MSDVTADLHYQVVINDEEQFSIWTADRNPPEGWRPAGFSGPRDACLDHIAGVWTDMRPLSARTGANTPDDRPR